MRGNRLFVFGCVVSRAYWCAWGGRVSRSGEWGSRSLDDGSCYTRHLRDLDVPEATFTDPDLTTFLGPAPWD